MEDELPILFKVLVYDCDLNHDELWSFVLVNADYFAVGVRCHSPYSQSFPIDVVYLAYKHIRLEL